MSSTHETLSYQAEPRPPAKEQSPGLYFILEANVPLGAPGRIGLANHDELVIGRGDERTLDGNELQLPAERLSRRHGRLVRNGGAWTVEDLGSKNGTFLDGQRVEGRVLLRPGAVLELGGCMFTLRFGEPAETRLRGSGEASSAMATLVPELASELGRIARAAAGDRPLLVLGESGTGKEVLAQELHRLSKRPSALVAVNCAALTEGVAQAQLFGHERGAFTGAVGTAGGFFRAAHRGTLFLDEIGDLALPAQAMLLRALQSGEIQPVGAERSTLVDVRIIAATNRPLAPLVQAERFRGDLYARLCGASITLPPLRERREDLGLLARAVLAELAPERAARVGVTRGAALALLHHRWPFNIRELHHALGAALEQTPDDMIDVGHLPPELRHVAAPERRALEDGDVVSALERRQGNVKAAALDLGVSRAEIYRILARLGIDPQTYRP